MKCLDEPLKTNDRSAFYYWEKNPEQNEEQVKSRFISNHNENSSNCKRSILGVSKSSHWMDEFNIGTVMHFTEASINDFDSTVPIEEYLFKDKLYELVIYSSMAHFTMATELRLIDFKEQESKDAGKEGDTEGGGKEGEGKEGEGNEEGSNDGNKAVREGLKPANTYASLMKKYGYEQKS